MNHKKIKVNLTKQSLKLFEGDAVIHSYPISSAFNGPGEEIGSGCTPRGEHRVRIKIGAGQPENSVFVGRRLTGEIYSPSLGAAQPERDWILCRILWLTGTESGRNRGGRLDTLRRYIYIHGCPDTAPMGKPLSHGCIRMRNQDLVELFDLVDAGVMVDIHEI
ncbi:Glutamate synthase [NADPH] large chain [hydrothermal vent metagenome]|uniref:Glutamate synthase [NADPH] large chain n=1 Tax=hydrothermal vent metagenome TaxID=652676 RepID=A0A3B1B6V8_9ZZZZ